MAHLMSSDGTRNSAMYWVAGFLAGFFSVLIFHQLTLSLLASMQITQAVPYSTKPL
jgi:hypothetical protein